ncbi:hypothetical protein Tco_0158717 [Tanacetum coccineum]
MGELEQHIADRVEENQALESRLDKQGSRIRKLETMDWSNMIREETTKFIESHEIDRKIEESVNGCGSLSVKQAMRAPLRLNQSLMKRGTLIDDKAQEGKLRRKGIRRLSGTTGASDSAKAPPPPPPVSSIVRRLSETTRYVLNTGDMANLCDWFCKQEEFSGTYSQGPRRPCIQNHQSVSICRDSLQFQMEVCQNSYRFQVDDCNHPGYNVSKPLPWEGEPRPCNHLTLTASRALLQTKNWSIVFIDMVRKAGRTALSISKLKAECYLIVDWKNGA